MIYRGIEINRQGDFLDFDIGNVTFHRKSISECHVTIDTELGPHPCPKCVVRPTLRASVVSGVWFHCTCHATPGVDSVSEALKLWDEWTKS